MIHAAFKAMGCSCLLLRYKISLTVVFNFEQGRPEANKNTRYWRLDLFPCSVARLAAVPLVKNVAYFSSLGREVLYAIYYDMITQHSIIRGVFYLRCTKAQKALKRNILNT